MVDFKKLFGFSSTRKHQLYLVTGADSSHAKSLLQFIRSVSKYEPNIRLVVYDLGLTSDQRNAVYKENLNGSLEYFPYDRFPEYFDIKKNAGEYAWKPSIILLEMGKSDAPVCWMDAGNVLTGRLKKIRSNLNRIGFYSPKSLGTIPEWTHPGLLEHLNLPRDWGSEHTNLNGACVAFNPLHQSAKSLAQDWAKFAAQKDCIAPKGSNRSNHRQDQARL